MRLGESCVASVTVFKFVLVPQVFHVGSELGLAVDKSEVELTVFLGHLFKDFPEPLASLGIWSTEMAFVLGVVFKILDICCLFTNTSLFGIAPAQNSEKLVSTDVLDSFSHQSHLIGRSVKQHSDSQRNIFFSIRACQFTVSATYTQFCDRTSFLGRVENEILVEIILFEILILEYFCVNPNLFQHLVRELISGKQVSLIVKLFNTRHLLPESRMKIETQRIGRSDSIPDQNSKEEKHLIFLLGILSFATVMVENIAVAHFTVFFHVIAGRNEYRQGAGLKFKTSKVKRLT